MEDLVRTSMASMELWFRKRRRKPLVLRGTRQVGKSTLVRQFAQAHDLQLAEVNLERHRMLEPSFASLNVAQILLEIEALTGVSLNAPNAVLFLDEIQSAPSALPALRYLYEEQPKLCVIAAGSLLDFLLGSHRFSMPVGRIEYFHLGPLTFTEFLHALGEEHHLRQLERWQPGEPFAATTHQALLARVREYFLVGGMPEAVASYAAGEGIAAVVDIHRSIVATYQDDFAKYTSNSTSLLRLQRVFNYVPGALGNKIKYTNISRDDRARDLRHAIELLALARVLWRVHHVGASGLPLQAQIDLNAYKCLFLDIGLAAQLTGVDRTSLGRWDDRQLIHEGGLAEQFIGQHLLFRHDPGATPMLHYWIRERKQANAEVDYVLDHGRRIIPVEVKAGRAGSLKSIHRFLARNIKGHPPLNLALRFDLNPPSLARHTHRLSDTSNTALTYNMLSLPLYLVDQTERLLAETITQLES